jgi:diguanylate cyclase (GGDEF)-like protein
MQTAADLFSQLTGTGTSPANALASYAIAAAFWATLFTLAKSATDRERDPMAGLLAAGFAVLLAGSVFMAGIAGLDAYSVFSLDRLQAFYPPVRVALSNLGLAIVAGALAGRLTGNIAEWRRFARSAATAGLAFYVVIAIWWAQYSFKNPGSAFSDTWVAWVFPVISLVVLGAAIVGISRAQKSISRQAVSGALALFFGNQLLELLDLSTGRRFESALVVLRGTPALAGLPLLTFAYIKVLTGNATARMTALEKRVGQQWEDLEYATTELTMLSSTDLLTGVFNRAQFDQSFNQAWAAAQLSQADLAVVLVDLDDFKKINNEHGHQIADEKLCALADLLFAHARRGSDLVARIGDEAFAILLPGADIESARIVAETVRKNAEAIQIDEVPVLISLGFASAQPAPQSLSASLIKEAARALNEAKTDDRNAVRGYDEIVNEAASTRQNRRQVVQFALDSDGVVMHFQPVVDTRTGDITGVEALARCIATDGTLHTPATFIGAINNSQLIVDLDFRAFEIACKSARLLADGGHDLPVSCNLAPNTLQQPDLYARLLRTAKAHGVDPSRMHIEITEAAFSGKASMNTEAIRDLSAAGFTIVLDNFGSGFSALSHLRDLHLRVVKIDGKLTSQITETGPEQSIAAAVSRLAEGLGLQVIAEGVESPEQLAAVRDIGVDQAQGWHFSPAVSMPELLKLIESPEPPFAQTVAIATVDA